METDRGTSKRRLELLVRLLTPTGEPKSGLADEPPLSTADLAILFRMSERAIRLLAAKGQLPHTRTLGGGRLLYSADQIASLYVRHYPDCSTVSAGRHET